MKSVISGVYFLKNTISKKVYVGSTVDIERRFRKHKSELKKNKHRCSEMLKDFNLYGFESFKLVILEKVEKEKLLEREQYWFEILKNKNEMYNKRILVHTNKNLKHSEETKNKISKNSNLKGEKNGMFGKKHSFKSKIKMSESRKGEKNHRFGKGVEIEGEKNPNSKLKENEVLQIIDMLNKKISIIEISKIFNISSTHIIRIKNGKTWKKFTNRLVI